MAWAIDRRAWRLVGCGIAGLGLAVLAAPARAEGDRPAGVLVGLAAKVGGDLRTVWLSPRSGAFAALELTPLVVPRRDGFWRVGLQRLCAQSLEPASPDGAEAGWSEETEERLWTAPVNGQVAPPPSTSCERRAVACRSDRSIELHFVWPDHVSLDESASSDCGAHPDGGTSTSVLGLTSLNRRTIGDALGPAGSEAFRRGLERGKQEQQREGGGACGDPEVDEASWSIRREAGRWKLVGWASADRVCGYGFDFAIDAAPSARIVGQRTKVDLAALNPSAPGVTDAFASPDGRLVLAVLPESLALLTGVAPAPRRPVLRVPLRAHEEVVMVEWATGANVTRWSAELEKLRRRRAPPP